jgi:septal ring factor EnvC (AmiA/AmiB activator)
VPEDTEETGLVLSTKRLGFILSLVTLASVIFGVFSTVNGWAYRIEKIEDDYKTVSEQTSKMADKVGNLNDQLVSLTITINRLEERMDARLK